MDLVTLKMKPFIGDKSYVICPYCGKFIIVEKDINEATCTNCMAEFALEPMATQEEQNNEGGLS